MDSLNENNKIAELEALLFIHGEPLALKKIEKILDLKEEEVVRLVDGLAETLESEARGLRLIRNTEKIQLTTKPNFSKILEQFFTEELDQNLTPASMEALAIIMYLGPISRNKIEYLRGVNSVFTIRNLLLRGLIERGPDPTRPSSYLYQASFDLVKHLGIASVNALPEYDKFRSVLAVFEKSSGGGEPVLKNNPETTTN
jgi:segregation and condensation protein B